ncbi:MAG: threonyl-tRNA synthetase editing domain-containing protein, partial [Calditrichaceae bacterium]
RVETRLDNTGYNVTQTPFGYFLDIKIDAPGKSLARVYKEF